MSIAESANYAHVYRRGEVSLGVRNGDINRLLDILSHSGLVGMSYQSFGRTCQQTVDNSR